MKSELSTRARLLARYMKSRGLATLTHQQALEAIAHSLNFSSYNEAQAHERKQNAKREPAYLIIQEGGTSAELYVHAHETPEEAEDDRISCAQGAYRTTQPVEIPPECAALGEVFYSTVEKVIESLETLETLPADECEIDED